MGYLPYPKQDTPVLILYPGDLIPVNVGVFNTAVPAYTYFSPDTDPYYIFQPIKTIYALSPAFRLAGEGWIDESISQLFYSPTNGISVREKREEYRYYRGQWYYPDGPIPILTPLRYGTGYFVVAATYCSIQASNYDPVSRQVLLYPWQDRNLILDSAPVWEIETCYHDLIGDVLRYIWRAQPLLNLTTSLTALTMFAGLASLPFSLGRKL
jgi:hypothetical protein